MTIDQVTPRKLYLDRRRFLSLASTVAAVGLVSAACKSETGDADMISTPSPQLTNDLTAQEVVTEFTNYYEFSLSKSGIAQLSKDLITEPWELHVSGLVRNPRTYDLDDLRGFNNKERIYRMRCVEGWSMVIPWIGFPLQRILNDVEPLSQARYVRFESLHDPQQMPGQNGGGFEWPYVEALTIDEAMHELTIMATGMYGEHLPNQNGAPVRLVVPWKYGFKNAKAVVRIELVEEMPATFWNSYAPREYGFYANVNPEVNHPRWSQATENRFGVGRIDTVPFNGYADQVAHLYTGLDLRTWY